MLMQDVANLWQESLEDDDFRFEIKAQEVAVSLAKVFATTGLTQKELAQKLGWKPSRVSKVLHGASNLTLKTLFDVCEALGTDFDVQVGGKSQLKQEIEVVRMKHEQLNEMLGIVWKKNRLEKRPTFKSHSISYELKAS